MPARDIKKLRATERRYREKNREAINARKRKAYRSDPTKVRVRQQAYQEANREKLYAYNAGWQRRRNKVLRAEMLAAYGSACACCGEAETVFLDLDHVHNDGAAHRREAGNSTQVMLHLRRRGWPKGDFQLLCCNCNQGKARNGGVCPHEARHA